MKISIFTTITDPEKRQDPWFEAIENYCEFADEVVIIDGGKAKRRFLQNAQYISGKISGRWEKCSRFYQELNAAQNNFDIGSGPFEQEHWFQKIKWISNEWPKEFNWKFIGEQFQRGYDACTGDWAIRMDIDYFIHEDDFDYIRLFLEDCDAPVALFPKRQFILADRYGVKSLLPIAFNKKKYGDRIKLNAGGDLCQPSLDGEEIKKGMPTIRKREYYIVGEGVTDEQKEKRLPPGFKDGDTFSHDAGIPIWNMDYVFKTQEVAKVQLGRFARAWTKTFNNRTLGGPDDESALEQFNKLMMSRLQKGSFEKISVHSLPKYIQEEVKNLTPEQHGYNCWGKIDRETFGI